MYQIKGIIKKINDSANFIIEQNGASVILEEPFFVSSSSELEKEAKTKRLVIYFNEKLKENLKEFKEGDHVVLDFETKYFENKNKFGENEIYKSLHALSINSLKNF